VRVILLALGVLALVYGAAALVLPRARFVESAPAPGVTLAAALTGVRITFDRDLHRTSYAVVRRVETSNVRGVENGPRSEVNDANRRTLIVPMMSGVSEGLYKVQWHARTRALYFTPFGTEGTFYFGIGAPVPPHFAAREWAEGSRARRGRGDARLYVLFFGVVCVVFGVFWRRVGRPGL
jgi:methionine-rich copper-binding protein CopC